MNDNDLRFLLRNACNMVLSARVEFVETGPYIDLFRDGRYGLELDTNKRHLTAQAMPFQ